MFWCPSQIWPVFVSVKIKQMLRCHEECMISSDQWCQCVFYLMLFLSPGGGGQSYHQGAGSIVCIASFLKKITHSYEIDIGVGHWILHQEASGKGKIEKICGHWVRDSIWSKVMGALGENVIFDLPLRAVPNFHRSNLYWICNIRKEDCAENHLK